MKNGYQKITLANGLRLVMHHMPGRQSLSLGIWIKTGGRYEEKSNKGIAHFLEHLLFKGTSKYSCRDLKESIEGVGGVLNGFTSEELTCYLVKIPCGYLNKALDILTEMVMHPQLPADEIEKERAVILEELKMYRDLPQSYCLELLDELLWPGQPLGEPIIGTVDSVNSIGRKALASFREKYYTASNIVVSAAGEFDSKKLAQLTDKTFLRMPLRAQNVFTGALDAQSGPRLKILRKKAEQTHMALGFKGFKRGHPLKYALGLLHIVLGANMSSRLFNELREKRGLAYEIGTAVKRFHDTGAFLVHAGIDNRKVLDALSRILKELSRIKRNLVTEGEFKRAKEFYIGQLKLGLEDTMEHMLWIGETLATMEKVYSLDEIIREVSGVSREDLLKVACELFSEDKLSLSLIGPVKETQDKLLRTLSFS
jgi:predicted Zn-dependent peptidase